MKHALKVILCFILFIFYFFAGFSLIVHYIKNGTVLGIAFLVYSFISIMLVNVISEATKKWLNE